jgi:Uma2 family endonuclease
MTAESTLVSVEKYLRTNYKPACDYIDGVLHQKPMPTRKHGSTQARLAQLINECSPDLDAETEVNVRIREGKYLVPDLIVQERDRIQDPYPSEPVYLCVEVLSPDDRLSVVVSKCEDYAAWGVQTSWIVDPESQRAWEYSSRQLLVEVPAAGSLQAGTISIPLADVFSVLA